jgi:membrane protease YdiL (CAAX protease family)
MVRAPRNPPAAGAIIQRLDGAVPAPQPIALAKGCNAPWKLGIVGLPRCPLQDPKGTVSVLDLILNALLCVAVPAFMVWTSRAKRDAPPGPRARRYLRTICLALALDGLLAATWAIKGRTAAALGLAVPLPPAGLVGLALAVGVLLALIVMTRFQLKSGKAPDPQALALFPTTRIETALFLALVLVIGTSWEILYRGYLIWSLTPRIGLIGAVLVAALAYGLAHGLKDLRQAVGSLVAALIFTSAYAVTGSLWWLILIHTALPLFALLQVRAQGDRALAGGPGDAIRRADARS